MAYIAPLHRPSGVRTAVKLNLLSAEEESLVVAKSNRLEVYHITADGIILQHSKTIYGTVSLLTKLRPPDSETDLLFVGTDRYVYFVLSWDASKKQLQTVKSYVDLADKLARPSQSVDRCVVDPSGRFMILEVFEGTLTVIPLYSKEKGRTSKEEWKLGDPIPMRISERFIRSLCFLQNREVKISKQSQKPRLAILYDDGAGDCRRVLQTLKYTAGSNDAGSADFDESSEVKTHKGDVEYTSSHVLPVEKPYYGSLVLSEASISYWNDAGEKGPVYDLPEATIWSTWTQVDAERWLLADDYGKLYFLGLVVENEGFEHGEITSLRLDPLGRASRASVLVYLDAGYFYVGSKSGDSQVIRINETGDIEVVQNLAGIAPVTDFAIMDMGSRSGEGQVNEYSSGQARIVTGSGAFEDGSLRSIRSGVGIEDLGSLGELEHITNLFALSSKPSSMKNVIVASFVNETRVFEFSQAGEVEEAEEFHGFTLNEGTLFAQNLGSNKILQVTGTEAKIVDLDGGMAVDVYTIPNGSIVAASANKNYLLLSIDGSQLVTLDLHNSLKVIAERTFEQGLQVSCLDLPILAPDVAMIGFWQSAEISVLRISSLETIHQQNLGGDDSLVPRSLLLAQLLAGQLPTLLVAMADGTIVTLEVNLSTFHMTNQKSTILGTQQANLKILPREDGLDQVFAACEHPSLIYGSEGRYVYSAVTVNKASCVCSFDSEGYPGSIAMASSDDLKIALIDNERTTHVQTLHIGETVRRIVYSPSLKAFGLGCVKRTLVDGAELVQSSFKLADEVIFQELDSYQLKEEEIIESVMRAQLKSSTGRLEERFVVGTAYIEDGTEESIRGRILVFEVSQDRQLILLAEQNVRSACRALAEVEGKIAAALMKTLVIYSLEHDVFQKLATVRTATAPVDIAVNGNIIAIGDLMKSLSIVRYIEGEAGENGKIEEVARHFSTAWTTAIAEVDENTYLESDAEGNLIVLHQTLNGLTQEDQRRLQMICEFRLGEMVNKIRPIRVSTSSSSAVIPRAFLATVEGSLYLFGVIRPEKQDLLMRLQSSIARFVKTPGLIPFEKYRAYHSLIRDADEPFRFVDGELIETFLDCDEQTQHEMIEGLPTNIEEVRGMIENLRRMH